MPAGKSRTHGQPDDDAADAAVSTQGQQEADDVGVLWRRKAAQPAAEAAPETALPPGEWEARLAAEQARADDYLAKWQRAAADMSNMRRRHESDRQEYTRQANATLISELLPVLDSFDRALAAMPTEVEQLPWIDGVKLVARQLHAVMERAGLSVIEAEGRPFDPNEHEAVMHEDSELPEGTVTGELQRGYRLYDRVLRPSMVKVAKGE